MCVCLCERLSSRLVKKHLLETNASVNMPKFLTIVHLLLFNSSKKMAKYDFSPCVIGINYCFICLFGALSLHSTVLAKLWGFLSCGLKALSDFAKISSLSVTNIWVFLALFIIGRPSGAGPFPGTLNVRRASNGGLTFITTPRLDRLLPTVPIAKLCIWFC